MANAYRILDVILSKAKDLKCRFFAALRMTNPQRGVALLIVLGAISMLTIAVVEFSADTDIQYELALNERDRLRAEYLAYSASNLIQLELQIEKSAKSLLANAPASMTQGISGPLCKQFPMSSALLRGVFLGDSEAPSASADKPAEKPAEKASDKSTSKPDDKKKPPSGPMINAFQQQAAQKFLSFVGDFDGQCEDLQSRMNLNVFFDLDPAQQVIAGANPYDQYKLTLMALIMQPSYKEIIGDMPLEQVKNNVRNIADWVDKNDQINDMGGVVAGPETGLYDSTSGPQHIVKNGKMLSVDEVFLVKGVNDDWFGPFHDMITVYGDDKVNVCLADGTVTMALITRYVTGAQKYAAVDLKNPELKAKLLLAIAMDCKVAQPQATKIGQDVDTILSGGTVAPTPGTTPGQTPQPAPAATPPPASGTTPAAPSVASTFSQMITTDARWYELKSTGQVGDVVVHLTQVWDTKDPNPKLWKMVYSKFE